MKTILKISLVSLISSGLSLMLFISFYETTPNRKLEREISVTPVNYSRNSFVSNTEPFNFVEPANKSIGAVVHIKSISNSRISGSYMDLILGNQKKSRIGTGSGVIVSPDG